MNIKFLRIYQANLEKISLQIIIIRMKVLKR